MQTYDVMPLLLSTSPPPASPLPMSPSPSTSSLPPTPLFPVTIDANPFTIPSLLVLSGNTPSEAAAPLPLSDILNATHPAAAPANSMLQSSNNSAVCGQQTFPAALTSCTTDPRASAWAILAAHHGDARLRNHAWEWINGSMWLPVYRFQHVAKITDIWEEHSVGLKGFLSVRELTMTWGAKWRKNDGGQKTEAGRRKKVVDLVESLAKKPRWDTALALRFIRDRYEGRMTPRGFCDHLSKNLDAILREAASYP
jgi:hypothetical protein